MKLTLEGLKDVQAWKPAGIALPDYDIAQVYRNTINSPTWVHFGIGNIFRIFIGSIADRLLSDGKMQNGLTCVETYDYAVVDEIYKPHDNLELSVILNNDGSQDCRVLAPFGEAVKADCDDRQQWSRLQEIFRSNGLQMASFTITEKGYALTDLNGKYSALTQHDLEAGPDKCRGAMAVVTAMLYQRFQSGAAPIALVSMDNCSHNGARLEAAVKEICDGWVSRGFVRPEFEDYISNRSRVAFPWTMIDKITPRPSADIQRMLESKGVDDISAIVTDKKTFIAPFGNAEAVQYLVIEDDFPNGRPPFEKAGVYMADRDTVNKSEKMKVNTCLNPIHTALCTYDCMLGYDLFADGMSDPDLSRLAHQIGYVEGLPVVADPGIISPKEFLDEVVNVRMLNPYLGDTSQRIAVDISQMVRIRFGVTIQSYCSRYGSAGRLVGIPLAIAGWLRYLLALDDQGQPFSLAPDPMIPALQEQMKGIHYGYPQSVQDHLHPILSNTNIFGLDLYAAGLGRKIENMFREEIAGPGAVRSTLSYYMDQCG